MDIQRIDFSVEYIAKWIGERIDNCGTSVLIFLLSLAGLVCLRRNNLNFLYDKNIWAGCALFFCFGMVSGQMWNRIRRPPFYDEGRNGQISYIHGSTKRQLVLETYIIMILNAAVVLGMILLTKAASNKGDPKRRKIYAILGLILVSVFFSVILSVFRSKIQEYPYGF